MKRKDVSKCKPEAPVKAGCLEVSATDSTDDTPERSEKKADARSPDRAQHNRAAAPSTSGYLETMSLADLEALPVVEDVARYLIVKRSSQPMLMPAALRWVSQTPLHVMDGREAAAPPPPLLQHNMHCMRRTEQDIESEERARRVTSRKRKRKTAPAPAAAVRSAPKKRPAATEDR